MAEYIHNQKKNGYKFHAVLFLSPPVSSFHYYNSDYWRCLLEKLHTNTVLPSTNTHALCTPRHILVIFFDKCNHDRVAVAQSVGRIDVTLGTGLHKSSSSSSSSYICHGVGPLVYPFRSHVSRNLFKGLP